MDKNEAIVIKKDYFTNVGVCPCVGVCALLQYCIILIVIFERTISNLCAEVPKTAVPQMAT